MTGSLFDIEDFRYAMVEAYLNAHVALQIRGLREKRGWSQEELARRAGLHQTQISNLEMCKWKHDFTTETLRKVARAFGVRLRISFETWSSALNEILDCDQIPLPATFEDDPEFLMVGRSVSDVSPDPTEAKT